MMLVETVQQQSAGATEQLWKRQKKRCKSGISKASRTETKRFSHKKKTFLGKRTAWHNQKAAHLVRDDKAESKGEEPALNVKVIKGEVEMTGRCMADPWEKCITVSLAELALQKKEKAKHKEYFMKKCIENRKRL